jgi:hypothetical protein
MKEIEFLEDEVVAIGIGLPLMDTRRFQKAGTAASFSFWADGGLQINATSDQDAKSTMADDAELMLNYLFRLLTLIDEAYPDVLDTVQISHSLPQQSFWPTDAPSD